MSREARLIAILAVIGAVGVAGLTMVANQYRKALESVQAEAASSRAARLVDGYLAAREAAKSVIVRYPAAGSELSPDAADAYRAKRSDAIAAYGMTFEDYAVVRNAWRSYCLGGPVSDPALAAAFDARRAAMDQASLGESEAVDDAIN